MDENPPPALLAAAAELLHEEFLQLGIEHIAPGASSPPAAGQAAATTPSGLQSGAGAARLNELAEEIARCQACGLCQSRNQTVPGEGSPMARLAFIGEAPGADEDQSGRPFIGRAGQLLTKIIEQGMGLPRQDVYIANVLKCRPPGNRDPQPAEKAACTPYLEKQMQALQPELMVALGRHAANHLLQNEATLGSMRGKIHQRKDAPPVLVTYHPAYLLRTPAAKADCWTDIQLAMQFLGMTRPKPNP